MDPHEELSLLDKIDAVAPAPLKSFDTFPNLPSTNRTRSSERGFLTFSIAFLLVANSIWQVRMELAWPDQNVCIMPPLNLRMLTVFLDLTVDLRDVVDATTLKEHAEALTVRRANAESRKSRGFLADLFRRSQDLYKPTYNHVRDGSACRIHGSLAVKRIGGTPPCDSNATLINASLISKPPHHYARPWLYPFSHFIRRVGVIGGIFVCASWGLRATDRVILAVAGPDDTGSIAPTPDSSRGCLRSPYGSTYSGVSSYTSSPAGSPMPYAPYSPAMVPLPLSGRTPSGGYPGIPSGLGLSPGLFGPIPPGGPSGGGLRTPATAATLGLPAPGLGTLGLDTPAIGYYFPPTPRLPLSGFAAPPPPPPPPPRDTGKMDD
ncbi:hypothetical protein EDB83DRAFT_2530949 [Lactarius deliciosus]|nr:hypothetical protein EDB83DRAFT_2530949 [Lactarius deliciosus]